MLSSKKRRNKNVIVEAIKTLLKRKESNSSLLLRRFNLKEIREVLEVTESRISQLHTKPLCALEVSGKSKISSYKK